MPRLFPLDVILRYPLAPVLLWQGMQIRMRGPRLPEAAGPRSGRCGAGDGLSVLILGDSSGAGVGVAHQDQALGGQLARALAGQYDVQWQVRAQSGATTRDALRWMQQDTPRHYDVAVLALGVNDVLTGAALRPWLRRHAQLREVLRRKFGVRQIIVTAVPPVGAFPAIPPLLSWVLGAQATRLDAGLRAALTAEPDTAYLTLDLPMQPDVMASDGFHPSAATYTLWAQAAADLIAGSRPSAAPSESRRPDE